MKFKPARFIRNLLFGLKVQPLRDLEARLGYRFTNSALLVEALTHRSSLKETGKERNSSYERLEFLGDAVLGLVVSRYLFKNFPNKDEGELTKIKATLVSEANLSRKAKLISLGRFLYLSSDEEKSGGKSRHSILSDSYEAILGAIFLDGGIIEAEKFIQSHLLKNIKETSEDKSLHNYKGELLEFLQAKAEGIPKYDILEEEGPDHQKIFTVGVFSRNRKLGTGSGASKKEAEQNAAKMALEGLDKNSG
ncbi:MAG: ribonuclease III [candidate division Zixibacteria bacterium]|nr:ribonuclease III [candidate division Zixibacteria bacterium]